MWGVWGDEWGPFAPHVLSGENPISPLRPPKKRTCHQVLIHRPTSAFNEGSQLTRGDVAEPLGYARGRRSRAHSKRDRQTGPP